MKDIFIHNTSIIDDNVIIGSQTKVWAFTHICSGVVVGKNCVIGEGVHIGPNVIIGDNCKIQNHSILYEGVELENNVFMGPSVITTNDIYPKAQGKWDKQNFKKTLIKSFASIGANCTIVCGNTIGSDSLIGAGSVITKNIPSGSVAYGNPAKLK